MTLRHQKLTISWRDVPRRDHANEAWRWLQQLGLMTHSGGDLTCDPALLPYVLDISPARRPMSQRELDERLEQQRQRSILAEQYVLALERERLRAAGVAHMIDEIIWVSPDDVAAGYDIRSFEVTGAPRFIEVKSSAAPRQYFVLTRNEYETACQRRGAYWIAWVGWAARLPNGPCEVAWFRDPVALLGGSSPWQVGESDKIIHRRGDDTKHQAVP